MTGTGGLEAQAGSVAPATALQGSNLLNPNISVIGWFQGEAGHKQPRPGAEEPGAFEMKETEISYQAVVDPYARADFFTSIGKDGIDLEEGYISWFHLPWDIALKTGKIKSGFGRFNTNHSHNIAFADRPLVHEKYFGKEGLAESGGSLSWHVPNPWIFVNLDAEVFNAPSIGNVPAFEKARPRDLLYNSRLSGYFDLTESANLTLGASKAEGPVGEDYDPVAGSSATLKSRLHGLDLTFRWKNPRRSIYRALFWQTEALWSNREMGGALPSVLSMGSFTHLEYQFAQRWKAGARFDWSESPDDARGHDKGGLMYLTFTPTEFSLISLQGKRVLKARGDKESLAFLRITFNIGPHGGHPF